MSKGFAQSIRKALDVITRLDLLCQAGPVVSLTASDEFKKSVLRTSSYRELYDVATQNQDFNVMLTDRSFFQFTEQVAGKDERLAYYPNPYEFVEYEEEKKAAIELLESSEIDEHQYQQLLSESTFSCNTPLIRFDIALHQYCPDYHSAAHLHVGFWSENRWPVRKLMNPLVFVLQILKMYYPNTWKTANSIAEDPMSLDLLYRRESQRCHNVPESHFSEIECQRLHFG